MHKVIVFPASPKVPSRLSVRGAGNPHSNQNHTPALPNFPHLPSYNPYHHSRKRGQLALD